MICFACSEEQTLMKETAAKLVQGAIADAAHQMDETGRIPDDAVRKFRELGTLLAAIPEEYGGYGMGNSPIMNSIILEELAAGDMGFAIAATLPALFLMPVMDCGTDAQKARHLADFAADPDGACGTLAINEPRFRFDPYDLATTAVRKNGSYILNGTKCFVPLAETARRIMIAAALDGTNGLFIVDRNNPGLTVGAREKNLGLNSLATHPITLTDCEIPADDRLGGDAGCDYDRLLQRTWTAIAAIGTGICRASYEYAKNYAKEREQFGEAIASRQSIAFMIAEMAYEVDAMRLMTWKAASALEAGRDAQREAYLARIYAGEMAMKLTDYGVQVLGGHGYIREHPVERYYRNGRGIAILEGMAIA
ncbi:MAG TPA: acyl-CoA dehydrogenase family protein [Spirochaetota bacterium]|nr:acyl-CoA dehydrogenase family protein [Spirochaetota bacterium]HOS39453.1 acyl-CoA dehydrogenase family protein [Spirochaetota bacterium]HPI24048.1 acyl-CoA dehydrogenase family protein [Spirochaetota bacterium]HPU89170.1 acyl-CoA dehydrogenase family protein [Spirochaetota bacterium]